MKKLFAMLLVLCLLCGAVCATAEEGKTTRTYEMPYYVCEIPDEWSFGNNETYQDGKITFHRASWIGEERPFWPASVSRDEYPDMCYSVDFISIDINHWEDGNWIDYASGYRNLKEAAEYEGLMSEGRYIERNMPDGSRVACAVSDGRWICMWIKGSLMAKISIEYGACFYINGNGFEEEIREDVYKSIIVPFFASIRPIDGEQAMIMPEPVKTAEGKQSVRLANALFQLDDDIVVSNQNDNLFEGENAHYILSIVGVEWNALGITDINITGDEQRDNAYYCTYLLFQDEEIAASVASQSLHADCNMLNGADVMIWASDDLFMLSHYYRGTGFFLLMQGKDSTVLERLPEIAFEVAMSFRLDGVSEEDMMADAEALAAAEAEAAALAAMQKYIVITGDTAKVRTEASISGGLIKTVYKGETFPCNGESGDFYIIEIDGKTGYVHKGVSAIQ